MSYDVLTAESLKSLYPAPSSKAEKKRVTTLDDRLRDKLSASCFCVIASMGSEGVDCSPRGDAAGNLVQVLDANTLAIPDRPGSHRLDTALNVIENGHVALWFLSERWQESVRVLGRARLSTDPELLKRFEFQNTLPITVMVVTIEQVAIHNDRAIRCSGLLS